MYKISLSQRLLVLFTEMLWCPKQMAKVMWYNFINHLPDFDTTAKWMIGFHPRKKITCATTWNHAPMYVKARANYSCSCSVPCASVNVDGFTSPSSTINQNHWSRAVRYSVGRVAVCTYLKIGARIRNKELAVYRQASEYTETYL
jgi:hypothetical protein